MEWQDVQMAWNELGSEILATWPETRMTDLMEVAGDRTNFAQYLARSHDLTPAEAHDTIDEWLLRIPGRRVTPKT